MKEKDEVVIFRAISERGDEGILQSELWKKLNISDRKASRIALRLEERGLIRRERELYKGRWTYRLFLARRLVTIDSIADCPCTACEDIDRCSVGGVKSPEKCEKLTKWILELAERRKQELVSSTSSTFPSP